MSLATPVALFIFKRPHLTELVFESIAQAKPTKLLVVADGPRHAEEAEKCAQARNILNFVDWPCEVRTNFADKNLGLRRRVSTGLNWVFEQVEDAIILEDDCVPEASFFPFCAELLDRYRHDERIMHISGDNFQFGHHPIAASYYFSRYPHIWGWATWRRAWAHYDVELGAWTEAADQDRYLNGFEDPSERVFWRKCWDDVTQGIVNTWDYQWVFACLAQQGLCVVPAHNLVSNIGFGEASTNTVIRDSPLNRMMTHPMRFPLSHPMHIERDVVADARTARLCFSSGAHIPPQSGRADILFRLLRSLRGFATR